LAADRGRSGSAVTQSSFAVAPHEAVRLALLKAHVLPAVDPPAGYNELRARMWVKLSAHRTLPTSEEFEADWRELRAMLVAAGAGSPGHRLASALAAVDQAWGAAYQSGLLDRWE
jgi:hypothetical protein